MSKLSEEATAAEGSSRIDAAPRTDKNFLRSHVVGASAAPVQPRFSAESSVLQDDQQHDDIGLTI